MSHIKNAFALLVRLILVSVAMSIAYMVSTLVIGQTETTDILPFVIHFRGFFASDPYIIPFQLMRGALWTALAALIVSMMNAKRWESALAVALIFAGLLSSGIGLFPNPYMPSMVRQSHFYEILSSMLLFGGVAGWTLYHGKQPSEREQIAASTQNPSASVEAR